MERQFALNIKTARRKVNNLLADLRVAAQTCTQLKAQLTKTEDHLTYIEEAQQITQQVAQEIQQLAHQKIASVVSRCLESVFSSEDTYGFEIHFERKRGKTEAILVLTKNGHEVTDPLNADSGGVIDVAAFALRTSCIMLAKPKLRRFLSLDEPFKFVSREFRDNLRALLEGLAEDLNFQYLMVTHEKAYQIGKVVEL